MIKLSYPLPKQYLVTFKFGAYPDWLRKVMGRPHNGVDFGLPHPQMCGVPVLAAHNGLVVYAKWEPKGGGNTIILREGNVETMYCHLKAFSVRYGVRVQVGQQIGSVGNSGFTTGCHLHFSVREVTGWKPYRIKYLDPEPLLSSRPSPGPAPKPEPAAEFYTVKKGRWRSDVIQEIINAGIWKGSWRDHKAVFDALNPVTPRDGWKPGDKVSIFRPELKPPPKPKEVIRTCGKCGHKHKCKV